ncbi:MAG: hypothetical protein MI919_27590, partial [Holophagales bacterium]|nr:hypothetical protein [Holophagales bacterium]
MSRDAKPVARPPRTSPATVTKVQPMAAAKSHPGAAGAGSAEWSLVDPAERLERAERLGHHISRVLTASAPIPPDTPGQGPKGTDVPRDRDPRTRETAPAEEGPSRRLRREQRRESVQRRPWLDDKTTGMYKDAKMVDTPLAFVTNAGGTKNLGVFIEYANLASLFGKIGPIFTSFLSAMKAKDTEAVVKQIAAGFSSSVNDLLGAVGKIYIEEGRNLVELPPKSVRAGIVLALVRLGAAQKPFIRNEGGGSRLPDAAGSLYIDRRMFKGKKDLLTSLGIPEEDLGDFSQVKEVLVDSFETALKQAAVDKAKGANTTAGTGFVYASTVVARRSANRNVTAAGKDFDDDFTGVGSPSQELTELTQSYESLDGPNPPEWVADLAGGRDGDQISVMGRWNSLGVAAFHNKFRSANGGPVPLDTNWEWLHIRGAQIGGETEQGNLIAGTFAANSEMIPFESQIQKWHQGNHGRIFGRFSARTRDRILADRIRIEIAAKDHPELGTIPMEAPLTVDFFPLEGKVVDKLTGKIQQEAFRVQAEGRERDFRNRLEQLSKPPPMRSFFGGLGEQTSTEPDFGTSGELGGPSTSTQLVPSNASGELGQLGGSGTLTFVQTPEESSVQ